MPIFSMRLTDLRPNLTAAMRRVEGGEKLILRRHGKAVAALVNMTDFNRVWEAEDEELYGPINPATGRRPGPSWRHGRGVSEKLKKFWTWRDKED